MCTQTRATVLLWRSKDNVRELVLFLHSVDSRDPSQVTSLLLLSTEPSHQPAEDKYLNDKAEKSEELAPCTYYFMLCQGNRLRELMHEYAEMQAFYVYSESLGVEKLTVDRATDVKCR